MDVSSKQKYGTLLSLYLAQSVPMSFFSTVMPVIMRSEHYSLTAIGLIQLIKLPWILKFLWAPLVDKTSIKHLHYKQWIIASELFYAITIFSIGFLQPDLNFKLIIFLMLLAFTASATQDIATDAFAILILKRKERGQGNSMQSAGSFLGALSGSGVLLIVYHYYGWFWLLAGLAVFAVVALIPLLFYPNQSERKQKPEKENVSFKDIWLYFKQKDAIKSVLLLIFYYAGMVGILTMSKPWLIDLGYSIKEVGIFTGIYGAAAGALFAFPAGYIIKRLGVKKAVRYFPLSAVAAALWFYKIQQNTPSYSDIIVGMILLWGAYGMATVAVYTYAMNNVRKGREGTDFTIQIVITHLGSLLIAVGSGKLTNIVGYQKLFFIEVVIALALFLVVPQLYSENKKITNHD